jgi:hypothetical protein
MKKNEASSNAYEQIAGKSWSDILDAQRFYDYPTPLTVHLPLQPYHSRDLIHLDAALNVCRRRVIHDRTHRELFDDAKRTEVFLVQFALDNPPFVPDWNFSTLSLAEDRYPIAKASYYAWEQHYELEYIVTPVDENQSLLWINATITSESKQTTTAHLRVKPGFYNEAEIFDWHYVPFWWDASKWKPSPLTQFKGDKFLRGQQTFGRVVSGDFSCAWETKLADTKQKFTREDFKTACEKRSVFRDDDYRLQGQGVAPSAAHRLKKVENALHLHTELAPGAKATCSLSFLVNYEEVSSTHLAALNAATGTKSRKAALEHFKKPFRGKTTSLSLPGNDWERIFGMMQTSILQMLIAIPGENWFIPTQGGSSERHFVWVQEAACMLRPMIRLGHFAPVRRALDFIFSLQDGGTPPEGRFTTLAGAVGTTGPRWMNSTGSALEIAAEYYLCSRSTAFLKEYLPKILRAADWIIGEIRATRKTTADGRRPLGYGLMPFGHSTDCDNGRVVSFTDTYTYLGLRRAAELLAAIGHERADEVSGEADLYQGDIQAAIVALTRKDGFIERKIVTGEKGESYYTGFENVAGAIHFVYTGLLDGRSERFRRYCAYFEQHCATGEFLGNIDSDVAYMGIGEWLWQDAYLKAGEWKKAFLANMTNLKYGMTQDTLQVQERMSRFNPGFIPWQPNGSGSGKILEMMVKSVYFEDGDTAILLGGIPWQWIDEQRLSLKGLYLPHGRVSIEAARGKNGQINVTVDFTSPPRHLQKIRVPEHFKVIVRSGLKLDGDHLFAVSSGVREISFSLKPADTAPVTRSRKPTHDRKKASAR